MLNEKLFPCWQEKANRPQLLHLKGKKINGYLLKPALGIKL